MDRSRYRVPPPAARYFEKSTDRVQSIVARLVLIVFPVRVAEQRIVVGDRENPGESFSSKHSFVLSLVRGHALANRSELYGAGEPHA